MSNKIKNIVVLSLFILLSISYVTFIIFTGEVNFAVDELMLKLSPVLLLWAIFLLFISYINIFKQTKELNRFFYLLSDKENKDTSVFEKSLNEFLKKEEELLSKKHEDFFASAELLQEKTKVISVVLDKTIKELSEKTVSLSSNIATLINNTEEKLSALNQTAEILKNSTFENETKEMVNLAKDSVNEINDASVKLEDMIAKTKHQVNGMIEKIQDLITTNSSSNLLFETNCDKLISSSEKVLDEASKLDKLIFEENELLIEKSERARKTAYEFKDIIQGQIENLSAASTHTGTYITLAENSLERQTTNLTKYIKEYYNQIENVQNKIGSATSELLKYSTQVNSEINQMGSYLIQTVEATYSKSKEILNNATNDSNAITSNISGNIERTSILLNDMTKVKETLKPFVEYMVANISKIPDLTIQTQEAVIGLKEEINNLTHVSEQTIASLSSDIDGISLKSQSQVISLKEEISSSLNDLAGIFDNFNNNIVQTKEMVVSLNDISENSIKEIYEGTSILKQENEMIKATSISAYKALKELGSQTNELIKTNAEFEKSVASQINNLSKEIILSQEKIEQYKDTDTQLTTALFAQKAGIIMENIQTVSVDIARLLNPSIKEEMWTKYYDGQKDIFVRHLSKILTTDKIEKLKELTKRNELLRDYINNFVSGFDKLLKASKSSDQKDIITATLMQTDMAQIYLILKQVY